MQFFEKLLFVVKAHRTCLEDDPEMDLAMALDVSSVSTKEVAFSCLLALAKDLLLAFMADLTSWWCWRAWVASTSSM